MRHAGRWSTLARCSLNCGPGGPVPLLMSPTVAAAQIEAYLAGGLTPAAPELENLMPVVLTTFYTAFSPSCFSLLGLWLVIIGINAGTWLNSGNLRQQQVYAVAQFFAAPGTMSLLALINPDSTIVWRVVFSLISLTGVGCVALFGPVHHEHSRDLLDISDYVVYWGTLVLYLAIAALAMTPAPILEYEGVLLTVLVLVGIHVALRLMLAARAPGNTDSPGLSADPWHGQATRPRS